MFTWSAYEAPGVDPSFICHHLNVNPSVTPKKKSYWRSSKDHSNAVKDEVMKLKQAGAIKEVFYFEWLANTVMVKKKEWEVANVCGFHRFKYGLSKRSFPYASNRLAGRCNCRPSSDELFGRLSRIPLNTTGLGCLREDCFCHPY